MVIRNLQAPTNSEPHPPENSSTPYPAYSADQSPAPRVMGLVPPPPQTSATAGEHNDSDDEWDKSDPEWDAEDEEKETTSEDLPTALKVSRPSSSQSQHDACLPASLRVGQSQDASIKSQENLFPTESKSSLASNSSQHSNNPFLRPHNTGEAIFGSDPTAPTWANAPSFPLRQACDAPTVELTTETISKLSLREEQPPLIPVETEDQQPWKQQSEIQGSELSAISAFDSETDVSSRPQPPLTKPPAAAVAPRTSPEQTLQPQAQTDTAVPPTPPPKQQAQTDTAVPPAARSKPQAQTDTAVPPAPPPKQQAQTHTAVPQAAATHTGVESTETKAKNQRKEHY